MGKSNFNYKRKDKEGEFNANMFHIGNGRKQLSMNIDPKLNEELRAYGYRMRGGMDVGRPGVNQKVDNTHWDDTMRMVLDQYRNPDSLFYRRYYTGGENPNDVVRDAKRILEIAEEKGQNQFVKWSEMLDRSREEIDDELRKSYEDSPYRCDYAYDGNDNSDVA